MFTLPHQLNPLLLYCEANKRLLLDLLFQAVADTLATFGRNELGGRLAFTLVLHTSLLRAFQRVSRPDPLAEVKPLGFEKKP